MSTGHLLAQGNAPRPPSRGRKDRIGSRTRLLSPSPPLHIELYAKRPLPPIPVTKRRDSVALMLSEKINKVLSNTQRSLAGNQINWAKEEADINVILDSRIRQDVTPSPSPSLLPEIIKRGKSSITITTEEETADPTSSRPKSGVRKMLALTGEKTKNSPWSSPSGHNPPRKIKQLTGVDVAPEQPGLDDLTEIAPMSCGSSVYSQELDATLSEAGSLDTASSYDAGYASDPNSSYVAQRSYAKKHTPGAVPSPLNITKVRQSQERARRPNVHKSSLSTNDVSRARGQDINHTHIARPGTPLRPPRPLKSRQTLMLYPQVSVPDLRTMNNAAACTTSSLPGDALPATPPEEPPSPRSPPPINANTNGQPADPQHWRYLLYNPNLYQGLYPPPLPPKPKPSPNLHSDLKAEPEAKFPRGHHRSILSKVFRRASGLASPTTPTSAPPRPSRPAHTKTLSAPIVGSASSAAPSPYSLLPAAEIIPRRGAISHRYTQSASTTSLSAPPIPPRSLRHRPGTAIPPVPPLPPTPEPEPGTFSAWDHDDEDTDRTGLFRLPFAMSSKGSLAPQKTGESAKTAPVPQNRRHRKRESLRGLRSRFAVAGAGPSL